MRMSGRNYARRTFHSLGNPNYRRFWISLILLMAGINMQMMARGQLAYDLTGDAFMVALVGSGFAPPILLFSLIGGTFADRWNRRRMIQYAQLAVSIVAFGVAVSIVTGYVTVWILFGAALTQGVCWSFMMPARASDHPATRKRTRDDERDRAERFGYGIDDSVRSPDWAVWLTRSWAPVRPIS